MQNKTPVKTPQKYRDPTQEDQNYSFPDPQEKELPITPPRTTQTTQPQKILTPIECLTLFRQPDPQREK